jgi:hypothetical protein
LSNRNRIIEGEIKCGAYSKKRMNLGPGAKEQMEKILMGWFQKCSRKMFSSMAQYCVRRQPKLLFNSRAPQETHAT